MGYLGNAPADQAVQIGDGVVDTDQLAADAVTSAKIEDNAVDTEHLAASAVETAKINNDAVTLAKMATAADGALITYDTSGNPVVITGSDGQVATSSGSGAVSAFEAAAGGNILQIKTLMDDVTENTSSASFAAASSIDVSITTSVANSHILVHYFTGMLYCPPTASELRATIVRTIGEADTDLRGDEDCLLLVSPGSGWQSGNMVYMDAPAQDANVAISYQVWFKETAGSATGAWIHYHQTKCLFQLMEISPSISTLTDSS